MTPYFYSLETCIFDNLENDLFPWGIPIWLALQLEEISNEENQ